MNTVITVNLGGNPFQIEEEGAHALRRYLESARAGLSSNPDCNEILEDIERAIAEKCGNYISAHKTVVTTGEMETIIKEMGPVEGAEEKTEQATDVPPVPKRLYRIPEGEILGGVATGLAAYFNVDVMLVRLIFVLLLILSSGGFIFAYIAAWILIPPATTAEERAAARGAPFTAEDLIRRARTEYENFATRGAAWRKEWKRHQRTIRKQAARDRAWQIKQAKYYQKAYRHHPSAVGELITLFFVSFLVWLGYHHIPALHDFINALWQLLVNVINAITNALVNNR